MADPLPPHARPNIPIPERARRLELAAAQADRAEDRRRVAVEALEAAVAEPRRVSRREFRVLAATVRASLLPGVRPETVAHQACRNLGWEVEAEPPDQEDEARSPFRPAGAGFCVVAGFCVDCGFLLPRPGQIGRCEGCDGCAEPQVADG